MNTKDFTRFMSYVDASGPCWTWKGGKDRDGYGNFYLNTKTVKAHRAAFEHFKGSIGDLIVTHGCDNPSCVNPDHLSLGTHKSNADEKQARGRGNQPKGENHYLKKHPEKSLKNEKHPQAKLNPDDVREIRRLRQLGFSTKELVRIFKIHRNHMLEVISGKYWSNV